MKEDIFKIIETACNEKSKAKSYPYIVTDVELHSIIKKKVLSIIRELWKEGRVDVGRTISNNFTAIRTPDSPKRNRKIVLHDINE